MCRKGGGTSTGVAIKYSANKQKVVGSSPTTTKLSLLDP